MATNWSQPQLEVVLDELLASLEQNASLFDQGSEHQSRPMSATVAVLLHETSTSKSVLGQLNRRTGMVVDISHENTPNNLNAHNGLVMFEMGDHGNSVRAILDDGPPSVTRRTDFTKWWERDVVIRVPGTPTIEFTRKRIVTSIRNKLGGAHLDTNVSGGVKKYMVDHEIGWTSTVNGIEKPITTMHQHSMRQIVHEILKTYRPNYSKSIPSRGMTVLSMAFTQQDMS